MLLVNMHEKLPIHAEPYKKGNSKFQLKYQFRMYYKKGFDTGISTTHLPKLY